MRRGYAVFDLIFSAIPCVIIILVLFPVFIRARESARRSNCQVNLKQIGVAFQQYVRDNDGSFPSARINATGGWADSLRPYAKSGYLFQCPVNRSSRANLTDYFHNARLSEAKLKNISFPTSTILAGDGNYDAPLSTSISSLPQGWRDYDESPTYRHLKGANYAFADGHVKWFKTEKISLKSPKPTDVYTFLLR